MAEFPTDWTEKVRFMREQGLTHATWIDGQLSHATTGPQPSEEITTQPIISPADREQQIRQRRLSMLTSASGGLVRRHEGQ